MYEYKSEKKGKKEKNMAGSLSLVINMAGSLSLVINMAGSLSLVI